MRSITWSHGSLNLKLTQVDEMVYKFSVRRNWRFTSQSTVFTAPTFEKAVTRAKKSVTVTGKVRWLLRSADLPTVILYHAVASSDFETDLMGCRSNLAIYVD